jgi:hypothetical protein
VPAEDFRQFAASRENLYVVSELFGVKKAQKFLSFVTSEKQ